MSFERMTINGVAFYRSTLLSCPHAFSTRHGGVSSLPHLATLNLGTNRGDEPMCVEENFRRISIAAGLPEQRVSALQIHSAKILYQTAPTETIPECDGFLTDKKGLTLTVKTADCIPILLYAPQAGIVAAVHAGWRGSADGIVKNAVKAMCDRGAMPKDIRAAIGPGIGRCCFRVREDFISAFTEAVGKEYAKKFIILEKDQPTADLKGLNHQYLLDAGLSDGHIDLSDLCTCCHPNEFYSHRAQKGLRGSLAAMIAL